MARAKAYDKWDDPGMAFSGEQIANYNIQEAGIRRMDVLIEAQNIMYAIAQIPGGQTVVPKKISDHLKKRATDLARVLWIEQPDPTDFDSMDPEFVLAAQNVEDLWEWAINFVVDTEAWITMCVTLGRRAAIGNSWSKQDHSFSNVMINQGVIQLRTANLWVDQMIAMPRKKVPGSE